ncbi:MAG: hypothetical protein IPK61_07250 [Saprospiraceae bacterium]|nr:hypothetical protein [Saprospiraceae bacterium]
MPRFCSGTNRHYQGDGLYQSIAASILAKTHRDEFMSGLSEEVSAVRLGTKQGPTRRSTIDE